MIRILGAVLAGGRSSRFGSDKALATWRDTALIDHALDSLSPHVADLLVVGRGAARVRTAPDLPHPDLGPLGGIAGALAVAAREGFDAAGSSGVSQALL
ncbi:NTP transferase domain-containing protein, partial [uncultured Sphingomonas sp.]|uniref:NTP transferase domain-containing protein n=1 Tax=uncultured Sphingomonas sp. TaxID=158754 RepID=UPI0025865BF0